MGEQWAIGTWNAILAEWKKRKVELSELDDGWMGRQGSGGCGNRFLEFWLGKYY